MSEEEAQTEFIKQFSGSAAANGLTGIILLVMFGLRKLCTRKSKCTHVLPRRGHSRRHHAQQFTPIVKNGAGLGSDSKEFRIIRQATHDTLPVQPIHVVPLVLQLILLIH